MGLQVLGKRLLAQVHSPAGVALEVGFAAGNVLFHLPTVHVCVFLWLLVQGAVFLQVMAVGEATRARLTSEWLHMTPKGHFRVTLQVIVEALGSSKTVHAVRTVIGRVNIRYATFYVC